MLPEPLFWNVHMYGVMIAVGILCGFLFLLFACSRLKIDGGLVDFVFYNGMAAIVIGFGSAALFQSFYDFLENPSAGFKITGGITFIGGLIGGAAAFLIVYAFFRRKLKGSLFDVLSVIPCVILVAHAFGRLGCFFAGCCYGKETDSFLGVKFPNLPNPVHPTQLYEAAFLFVMFGVCAYLLLRHRTRHNMSLYLFSYGIFRFFIEYVRNDYRGTGIVSFLTPSQFWSVCMVALAFLVYFLEKKYVKPYQSAVDSPASEA